MKHKPNTVFVCAYCGKESAYYSAPSIKPRLFCSPTCRNKARTKNHDFACVICGSNFVTRFVGGRKKTKQTCGPECAKKLQSRTQSGETPVWTKENVDFVRAFYPTMGAKWCAEKIGVSVSAVHSAARKRGLRLTPDATKRIVNAAAREFMSKNNPMYDSRIAAKMLATQRETGVKDRVMAILSRAKAKILKTNPSNSQRLMGSIMSAAGLVFESEYVIKDKFIVDFAFPSRRIIVQVDGCYWHGHSCRFDSLTDRQIKQQKRDAAQDAYLTKCGWRVIRIWECEIKSRKTMMTILGAF